VGRRGAVGQYLYKNLNIIVKRKKKMCKKCKNKKLQKDTKIYEEIRRNTKKYEDIRRNTKKYEEIHRDTQRYEEMQRNAKKNKKYGSEGTFDSSNSGFI
jgi:protein subunit release factor A